MCIEERQKCWWELAWCKSDKHVFWRRQCNQPVYIFFPGPPSLRAKYSLIFLWRSFACFSGCGRSCDVATKFPDHKYATLRHYIAVPPKNLFIYTCRVSNLVDTLERPHSKSLLNFQLSFTITSPAPPILPPAERPPSLSRRRNVLAGKK